MDLIAFCIKNPAPMLPHLKELKAYGQYWFVTITTYGKEIEPNVPDKEQVMRDFQNLSQEVGVDCSGCMTLETFETALHGHLDAPKMKNTRKECACYLGSDIGAYDTCGHLCRYCYANTNAALVRENIRRHDPKSPFLLGNLMSGEMIHQAKQESWLNRQIRLEL